MSGDLVAQANALLGCWVLQSRKSQHRTYASQRLLETM